MLKIKTGTSTNSQASMAGKEAAAQVKENLQDMKMAFVYSGVQYDQKEMLDAVSEDVCSRNRVRRPRGGAARGS